MARQSNLDAEVALTELYQKWTDAEGLPQLSADEHDHEQLTERQSRWIRAFCEMWDANDPYSTENADG